MRHQLSQIEARYTQMLADATKEFDSERIVSEWNPVAASTETALAILESKKLRSQADWWSVEIPEDVWVQDEDRSVYIGAGYQPRIKRLIRDARRESIKFWVGLITQVLAAATGLAGALIGVLSFLKRSPQPNREGH